MSSDVTAGIDLLFDMAAKRAAIIDLTHPLKPGVPVWPGHPHFCQTVVEALERGDVSSFHALALGEHTGTHIDAPCHFIAGSWSVADAKPERFFGRLAVLPVPDAALRAEVSAAVIESWERHHGVLRPDDAVLFHFGWDRFWDDDPRAFLSDWPGLGAEASALLVARGVRMVGSDCLSIDRFGTQDFPAHHALLGAGILIGENFANLGLLPPISWLACLPLPIVDGSGSPVRAIAFVDKDPE